MIDPSVHIVFDLDDTLYPEVDYSLSALKFVGTLVKAAFGEKNATTFLVQKFRNGSGDPISALWSARGLPNSAKADVVAAMRGHRPEITLPPSSAELLRFLAERGLEWSILTDGRSLTQRRKIEALGLFKASGVYISEERGVSKPALKAFTQIMDDQPNSQSFWYIADNLKKDFVTPNALGWKTFMLRDRGSNTHTQKTDVPQAFRASVELNDLTEILSIY